ncbi:MAG TPA: NUDIX domain-containing protein [Candidatus Angelobacter sp.]|nr:NUDIX domain-containing protein [Candidatus Angelobacter sp.]
MSIPVFGVRSTEFPCTKRLSVYAVVIGKNGLIALARTPKGLYLPGGGIDAGEAEHQALLREALEECGLLLTIEHCLGRAIQYVTSRAESKCFEKHCGFFVAKVAGYATKTEDDHELIWLDPTSTAGKMRHESHEWAIALLKHTAR